MSAALSFRDVTVRRGPVTLVENLGLEIPRGSHWAVLGPNGAGKSTMLRLGGGWLHPTTGTVDILGRRLGRVDVQSLRRRIGWVDPRHRLGDVQVDEVVLSGLTGSNGLPSRWWPAPSELERAGRLLELTGMAQKRARRWTRLSQGERARTLIARALITEPELLLLDEPSTGLDLPGRERLLGVVDELRRARPDLTTVLVTHHVEEIAASTTDVAMISDGKVLAAGPVGQVLTSEKLSRLYGLPVRLDRVAGRWFAHA